MKIVSRILILITVFLSFRHGWAGITMKPETAKMIAELGVNKTLFQVVAVLALAVGVLVLFPATFFIGNLINALTIVLIMALSLNSGNVKTALIEIPFLLMPLVLIWLGHPLKK